MICVFCVHHLQYFWKGSRPLVLHLQLGNEYKIPTWECNFFVSFSSPNTPKNKNSNLYSNFKIILN